MGNGFRLLICGIFCLQANYERVRSQTRKFAAKRSAEDQMVQSYPEASRVRAV